MRSASVRFSAYISPTPGDVPARHDASVPLRLRDRPAERRGGQLCDALIVTFRREVRGGHIRRARRVRREGEG